MQYLKKEVNDEVDFLHVDKHESLLQIDAIILVEMVKHFQSSQNSKFAMSLQYLKEEVRDEIFCMQVNIKVSYELISALYIRISNRVIVSFLMAVIKHFQSIQSNKFAISLQYLKDESRDGVHFLHA